MKKVFLILSCLFVQYSFSQKKDEIANKDDSIYVASKADSIYKRSNFAPFGQNALSNFVSNVSLSSLLKEGENGKIDLKYTRNFLTFGIAVDQKIGKNDEEAIPFDLEGISPGTKVEFNLQYLLWNPKMDEESFKKFVRIKEEYAKAKNKDPRGVMLSELVKDKAIAASELNSIKLKKPVFINVKYSFTKTTFSYVTDSFLLSKIEKNYIMPSFTFSIGFPMSKRIRNNSYLAFSYVYSEKYTAGDELNFFTPFGRSKNYYNQSLNFGEPKRKIDNRVSAEYRVNVFLKSNNDKSVQLGLAPSVIYGIDSKKIGVNLPIYFLSGKGDGKPTGLQGGVRFNYTSSTENPDSFKDGFGAQLIITLPFELLEDKKS